MERLLLPSKTKTLLIVAFCFLLGVLYLYLNRNAGPDHVKIAMLFWIAGAFFALQLHPGTAYLKLTDKGFKYKNYLPARFIEWKNVRNFTTYNLKGRDYVGWNYIERFSNRRITNRIGKIIIGVDDGLSENFQQRPEALARLLDDWRKKAG